MDRHATGRSIHPVCGMRRPIWGHDVDVHIYRLPVQTPAPAVGSFDLCHARGGTLPAALASSVFSLHSNAGTRISAAERKRSHQSLLDRGFQDPHYEDKIGIPQSGTTATRNLSNTTHLATHSGGDKSHCKDIKNVQVPDKN
jgi:hypothetical protein